MQSNESDENWSIANIEEQYIEAIERQQPNYEAQYLHERDNSTRNLFQYFQESATSIAQLYRGKILLCLMIQCQFFFRSFYFWK